MNIQKLVKKRFSFLLDCGWRLENVGDRRIFDVLRFMRDDFAISIEFDMYCEYIHLEIRKSFAVCIEMSHYDVYIDAFGWNKIGFADMLKKIYKRPRTTASLTQAQIIDILELYAVFVEKKFCEL